MQLSSLTKENSILEEKLGKTRNDTSVSVSHNRNSSKKKSTIPKNNSATAESLKSFGESVPDSGTTNLQVGSLNDQYLLSKLETLHDA